MGPIIALHVFAAVIWVGGMFFAYMVLRPAAAGLLELPLRLTLWNEVFARFFPWVWATAITLLVTGYAAAYTLFGSMAYFPLYVHLMQGLGWMMIGLYLWLYFVPWRGLQQAVAAREFAVAGSYLSRIRHIVAVNLTLGIIVVVIASGGRYFL